MISVIYMNATPVLSPEKEASPAPFKTWPAQGRPQGWFSSPATDSAAQFFKENGFLVLEDAFTSDEVDRLNAEVVRICRNEDKIIGDLPSASPGESDTEVMRRTLCIHFPHKISPTMFSTLAHPSIVNVLTRVVSPNVKCMQSMLFIKASGKPGQAWHQDEDYIPTRDRSLIGAWIALDDATIENGCLWILPGSHKHGILWKQHWHGDRRFDCAEESTGFPFTEEDHVPVEVKKGSVVFFNGYTLHRSLPNHSKGAFRRSLVNHYMSAESFLPWSRPDDKTSMAMADYRDIVMVAGTDPYAYKGTENLAKVWIRPSGEGGCFDWKNKKDLEFKA